ncbi:hypothetical protein FXF51_43835 [Nonomuraea sp. PA05]|uniref:hypothetical protein n=1 Tax=Nonomuraea sp. PA05 TaxID=2604466 RepID=UPI0011DA1111|nr:hypothetical protein [Nonomuraea sp. PA05]TYB56364.1 hypothetical protein FXF51_43835 [Nonomuraea sp. PA05]
MRWRAVWVGIALTCAVAAVALPDHGWFGPDATGEATEEVLEVGSAKRAALMAAADRFLETDPRRNAHNVLAEEMPELGPRTFCREEFVEVRRKDPRLLLGIVAACEEYARHGGVLVTGSGFRAPLLLTVEPAGKGFVVRAVEEPLDGDMNWPSVRTMFSPGGAPRALDLQAEGSYLHRAIEEDARRAWGLPEGTEVSNISTYLVHDHVGPP